MENEKIKVAQFIIKESEITDILIDFYRSTGKAVDLASLQDFIQADADSIKGTPEAAEYSWASAAGLAYLFNFEKISAMPKRHNNAGKELDWKPLATDEVHGIFTTKEADRKAKAEKKKAEEAEAKKQAELEGREYIPHSSSDYESPIVQSAKGDIALKTIRGKIDDLIDRANKTSILKVIRVHRPITERLVDKQNAMMSLSFNDKIQKATKILEDEQNLVQTPENIEAYQKIKEYIQAGDDAQLAVNKKASKGSWAGVRVHLYTGEELTLSRAELFDYVAKVGLAINLNDKSKPGAKIRWVTAKNKKNQQAEQTKTPVVVLTNTKAISQNAAQYEVYATEVDTSKKEKKAVSSELSYQVYAFDKDGKPAYKDDGTRKIRTKRAPGQADVYGEKQVKAYWCAAFEKSASANSVSAKSKQQANAIAAGLDAQAMLLASLSDDKANPANFSNKASTNDKIDALIQARYNEINFGAGEEVSIGDEDNLA